ncbi:MAG: ABC transporter permease [Gammaproteobacteria bacterium]|nr:MAG: ABC transporter permease [Gammaproteobacteria bacterium]
MRLQAVRAVARKEWRHLLRDPRSLALMFLMPTMLLFLFGYAVRLDVREAPIAVLLEEDGAAARDLAARLDASQAFRVVARVRQRQAARALLRRGEVYAVLAVPRGFARDLAAGRARLQLLTDGVDANTARLVWHYAEALLLGLAAERAPPDRPGLELRPRVYWNQARESRLAIVPGVIAIVMAVIGALLTSLTFAREMELGNLVMLRTTPLRRGEFLVGKLLPYFAIGLADLLLAAAAAVWLFHVPLRGGLGALVLVSALFLLVVMLHGALISISAGQQLLASQIALVQTFLPSFLLSGFIFAIENMPLVLQGLTYLVPARYYVALSKAIFLKGLGPWALWLDTAALALFLLVLARLLWARARRLGLLP